MTLVRIRDNVLGQKKTMDIQGRHGKGRVALHQAFAVNERHNQALFGAHALFEDEFNEAGQRKSWH